MSATNLSDILNQLIHLFFSMHRSKLPISIKKSHNAIILILSSLGLIQILLMILTPSHATRKRDAVSPTQLDLVIGIPIQTSMRIERAAIRTAWISHLPPTIKAFFISSNSTNEHDFIQIEGLEYDFLDETLYSTTPWFKYAQKNFNTRFIGKMEFNTLPKINEIEVLLRSLPQHRVYSGRIVDWNGGNWISVGGEFCMLSADLVDALVTVPYMGVHEDELDVRDEGAWLDQRKVKDGFFYHVYGKHAATPWTFPVEWV